MAGSLEQKLQELIEPIVQSYGMELWGLRYRAGRNTAHLQIFVEGKDGVDADACGEITNTLSPLLDTADLIDPAYILEVSSPGMDRILFTREQLAASTGQEVTVSLKIASEGRRKIEGKLLSVAEDGSFTVMDKNASSEFVIASENVSVARIVPDFSALI